MEISIKGVGVYQLVLFFATLFISFRSSRSEEMTDPMYSVSTGISHFTSSLYNTVRDNVGKDQNLFVSPYSISVVSAMALAGARGNTKQQLAEALGLKNESDENILAGFSEIITKTNAQDGAVTLDTANRIYLHQAYNVLESYKTTLLKSFHATSEPLNFGSGQSHLTINKWVEEQTRDKIKDLIPAGALNDQTRLVLVNAIYFKGNWLHAFPKDNTETEPFHLSKSNKIDVPMMHIEETFRVGKNPELGVRTLEMPYKGRRLSMLIVLPDEIDGLEALEAKLKEDPSNWKKLEQMMRPGKVKVALPKFKIESSIELSKAMIQMGVGDLFDMKRADLSGISGNKDLFASAIFHKAFIDVNEEGSEAAAATAVHSRMRRSVDYDEPEPPFVCDRAFLFVIIDNATKSLLFIGSLRVPESAEVEQSLRDEL